MKIIVGLALPLCVSLVQGIWDPRLPFDWACEDRELQITCESRKVIKMISANYGRQLPYSLICAHNWDPAVSDYTCVNSDVSLKVMKERCDGKQSCKVKASSDIFGDPCKGIIKYLEVEYQSQDAQFPSHWACEFKELELTCERRKVIKMISANYGRQLPYELICNPNWTLPPKNECVNFDGSLKVMKEQCDGKQSCKVKASSDIFGETCKLTYKYLEAEYQCQDVSDDSEEESYKVHPGVRCLGHDIKPDKKADIKGCEDACDLLPDCVGFVHSDDESRGFCRFKKDTCLKRLKPKPGLSLFVKPGTEVPKI